MVTKPQYYSVKDVNAALTSAGQDPAFGEEGRIAIRVEEGNGAPRITRYGRAGPRMTFNMSRKGKPARINFESAPTILTVSEEQLSRMAANARLANYSPEEVRSAAKYLVASQPQTYGPTGMAGILLRELVRPGSYDDAFREQQENLFGGSEYLNVARQLYSDLMNPRRPDEYTPSMRERSLDRKTRVRVSNKNYREKGQNYKA